MAKSQTQKMANMFSTISIQYAKRNQRNEIEYHHPKILTKQIETNTFAAELYRIAYASVHNEETLKDVK